ncbi:MAG TPA: hypothetical protein VGM27_11180, partial [Acidobacteriaceae bacterium]
MPRTSRIAASPNQASNQPHTDAFYVGRVARLAAVSDPQAHSGASDGIPDLTALGRDRQLVSYR